MFLENDNLWKLNRVGVCLHSIMVFSTTNSIVYQYNSSGKAPSPLGKISLVMNRFRRQAAEWFLISDMLFLLPVTKNNCVPDRRIIYLFLENGFRHQALRIHNLIPSRIHEKAPGCPNPQSGFFITGEWFLLPVIKNHLGSEGSIIWFYQKPMKTHQDAWICRVVFITDSCFYR